MLVLHNARPATRIQTHVVVVVVVVVVDDDDDDVLLLVEIDCLLWMLPWPVEMVEVVETVRRRRRCEDTGVETVTMP